MALTPAKQGTDSAKIPKRTNEFSLANTKKYNVNSLSFPDGITTDPDKLHYVSFFFNVRGKSKIFNTKTGGTKPSDGAKMGSSGENRVDPTKMGRVVEAAGVAHGITEGLALGRTLGSKVYAKASNSGATASQANTKANIAQGASVAAGAAIGGLVAGLAVEPDTTYRIGDVITLHIPHSPKVSYTADYAETSLGTLAGVISGGSSAVDTTRSAMAQESIKALALAAASMPNQMSKSMNSLINQQQTVAATQLAEGQSLNPFREVLFKQVGFRRFQFSYRFMPKNATETNNIFNIIKTFRYHMMPELSVGGLYYIHPSEVNFQYYFNGVENTFMNKVGTCVVENVDVTYGGDERFSTFHDGSPTEISMTITFRELSTLTKDSISQGF